jgi:hypothetical protein
MNSISLSIQNETWSQVNFNFMCRRDKRWCRKGFETSLGEIQKKLEKEL